MHRLYLSVPVELTQFGGTVALMGFEAISRRTDEPSRPRKGLWVVDCILQVATVEPETRHGSTQILNTMAAKKTAKKCPSKWTPPKRTPAKKAPAKKAAKDRDRKEPTKRSPGTRGTGARKK
jgi:hypothetical protein